MTRWWNQPLYLLLATGFFLGLYFPLGKLAQAEGIGVATWVLNISLLPGLTLLAYSLLQENVWHSRYVGFSLIAGFTAYCVPNFLSMTALPHLGIGIVSLLFAMSPMFTALLSLAFRVRSPDRLLLSGVALGLVGTVLIVLARNKLELPQSGEWLLLAMFVPISLAIGNVYRTAFWPDGMKPLQMAGLANIGALPFLIGITLYASEAPLQDFSKAPILFFVQAIVSLCMFVHFFRLQQVGGPTYLSQIGFIAAFIGLLTGYFLFGEKYPVLVIFGLFSIILGVVVSNWPGRRPE